MPVEGPVEVVDFLRRHVQLPEGKRRVGSGRGETDAEVRRDPGARVLVGGGYLLRYAGGGLEEVFADDAAFAVGADEPGTVY